MQIIKYMVCFLHRYRAKVLNLTGFFIKKPAFLSVSSQAESHISQPAAIPFNEDTRRVWRQCGSKSSELAESTAGPSQQPSWVAPYGSISPIMIVPVTAGSNKMREQQPAPKSCIGRLRRRFKFLIPGIASAALGAVGLAGAWVSAPSVLHVPWSVAVCMQGFLCGVASLFVLIFLFKAAAAPRAFAADLCDPRPTGALPACCAMAVMSLGGFGHNRLGLQPCVWVWRFGLAMHLALIANYTAQRVSQWRSGDVCGTWLSVTPAVFVVYVGVCAGAASSKHPLPPPPSPSPSLTAVDDWTSLPVARWETDASLYIGLACLLPLLLLVWVRVQRCWPMPAAAPLMPNSHRATIPILMAPSALCLTGWLSTRHSAQQARDSTVTHGLAALAFTTAAYVYCHAKLLLVTLRPNPGWASLTFPLDIQSIAALGYLRLYPDIVVLRVWAWVSFVAANLVVCFTLACYLYWLLLDGRLFRPYALFRDEVFYDDFGKFQPQWELRPQKWLAMHRQQQLSARCGLGRGGGQVGEKDAAEEERHDEQGGRVSEGKTSSSSKAAIPAASLRGAQVVRQSFVTAQPAVAAGPAAGQ